ncbi:MAG: hypothetical protein WC661_14075 [Opitutaceae bacterium]|jgi:hypothetical protein
MNFRSTRGEITLILLFALGTAVAGYFAGKTLTKLEQKKELDAHAAAARDAADQAKAAHTALEQANAANAKAIAADKDKEKAAAGFVKGTDLALAAEPTPSIHVRIAQTLNKSAADILPPADSAQIEEFKKIIAELVAKNTTMSDALTQKQQEAGALKAVAEKSEQDAATANRKALEASGKVVDLTDTVQQQAAQIRQLAGENSSLWDKIKTGVFILGGLWLASLVLPVAAKAFPALQPLAAVFGAVWSPGVQLISSGAKTLTNDMVALHEYVKGEFAKKSTQQEIADFKNKVKQWWDGDVNAQSEIEQVKSRILRA